MATGGRLRYSDVPDIYSCAVCMEHLQDRNPRFLSCHHSFCQQCLQKLTNNGRVTCPTCRAVTAVPNNDVMKLTMNFQLVQMMEREKELKMFKNHVILKLCQKHFEGISHICMKCVQAVCVKCIVLDHADHEDKVEEYQDGVGQLKSCLEETKRKLKERRNVIEKCQNEADSMKCDANKERMKLQRRRYVLVKEIEQIDNELVDVDETERKCNEDVKMYKELKERFKISCRNVDELLHSPNDQIILSFLKENISVEKILIETENLGIEFKMDINEEMKWLEKPVMENKFGNLGNFQINFPTSIKTLKPGLFVYSDLNTSRFVVFDNKGNLVRSFEGRKKHGKVKCVGVYKNCLYLAQEKKIMCLSQFNTTQERSFTFMPKMKSLYRMAVATDNILICTDCDEGRVYEYNTEDDTTKMVLQGLIHLTYISVDHTPQGTRYILSIVPFLITEGSVKIYNESWQLLTTIRDGINGPQDTAPCPGGFLLADYISNKITLYSYTGDLVRTVLTEEDGLEGPISLTLQPPYIWVGEERDCRGRIKCFRVL